MKRTGSSDAAETTFCPGGSVKSPRVESAPSEFGRGITLAGLKYLAAQAGERTVRDMWRYVWAHETVADGWTIELFFGDSPDINNFSHQTYTNTATGKQITLRRTAIGWSKEGLETLPPCKSILDTRSDLDQLGSSRPERRR